MEKKELGPLGRKRRLLERRGQLPEIVNRWSWGAVSPFDCSRERVFRAESRASCLRWRSVRQSLSHTLIRQMHSPHRVLFTRSEKYDSSGGTREPLTARRRVQVLPRLWLSRRTKPALFLPLVLEDLGHGEPVAGPRGVLALENTGNLFLLIYLFTYSPLIYKWSHLSRIGIFSNKENIFVHKWKRKIS